MPGPSLQDAQQIYSNAGLRTQYGVVLPPGARVAAYVRSTGLQSGDDSFLATNLVSSIALGLARCRSGLGDFVVVLPGHVETVTDATTFSNALLPGTRIVGVGRGSNMPTVSFTTSATAQWLVNKADVLISGLRFTPGLVGLNQIISVTGADCGFYNCDFVIGVFAVGSTTVYMGVAAGGDRCDISGNIFRGPASVSTGDGILISGAVDGLRICDNEMIFNATSANGLIRFSAAATNFKILRNTMTNTAASSIACLVFGAVAASGHTAYNTIQVQSTGAIIQGTTGITTGATMTGGFYQNFVSNDPRVSGILSPTADT